MNEKDVKKEMCDVCKIQNAGLFSACVELHGCIESKKATTICIALLEGIRNNLEVYDCEITKKLIRRVQFTLGKIRGNSTEIIGFDDEVLLKMLLNELNEVVGAFSEQLW